MHDPGPRQRSHLCNAFAAINKPFPLPNQGDHDEKAISCLDHLLAKLSPRLGKLFRTTCAKAKRRGTRHTDRRAKKSGKFENPSSVPSMPRVSATGPRGPRGPREPSMMRLREPKRGESSQTCVGLVSLGHYFQSPTFARILQLQRIIYSWVLSCAGRPSSSPSSSPQSLRTFTC